jgi:transcriptional regulator with XRE-family HTH domain
MEAVAEPELSFAGLLRQLRVEADLTQEELAEAASLSPRSVSDLERGVNRTARRDTARLLAGALGLAGPASELFVAAARGRALAQEVLAACRVTRPATFVGGPRPVPRAVAGGAGYQRGADGRPGSGTLRVTMLGGSAQASEIARFHVLGGCGRPRRLSSCWRWLMVTGPTATC